jgi:hypothetical protein
MLVLRILVGVAYRRSFQARVRGLTSILFLRWSWMRSTMQVEERVDVVMCSTILLVRSPPSIMDLRVTTGRNSRSRRPPLVDVSSGLRSRWRQSLPTSRCACAEERWLGPLDGGGSTQRWARRSARGSRRRRQPTLPVLALGRSSDCTCAR